MIETKYLYAGSRAKALETRLLSDTQMERLLSSKEVSETFKVLQDTFLAPYLSLHEKSDIGKALDESVHEAKEVLAQIAPEPELLHILWLKYDFYNLKAIVKGKRAGLDNDAIKEKCIHTGVYSPERLLIAYEQKRLRSLNIYFEQAREKAQGSKEVFEIDIAMNLFYFKAIKNISERFHSTFIKEYVSLLIDFFNLEAALRSLRLPHIALGNVFVTGGTFRKKDLEQEKHILEQYKKHGREKLWAEPIKTFKETGDFSLLEKTADEYTLSFLKEKGVQIMSPAPLFAYFSARKNNAQTIQAIMVAKKSGLSEGELRRILRRLYT